MNNNSFDYKSSKQLRRSMKVIDEMEEKMECGDKSAIKHGMDPNRIAGQTFLQIKSSSLFMKN